jgi:asparagine synthase (glutamine-hydrolysing)
VRPFVRSAVLRDPELFVRRPGFRDHLWAEGEGFLREPWAEPFTEETVSGDLLRNRMANELLHEVVPVILRHDDLNAMAFSIENRSPFLDRDLVEFAFRIPTRRLIRDGFSKAVLRDAVRGIVPDVVVDARRKVGFNAAIEELVDLGSAAVRQAVLADSPVYELVDRARVAALLEKGTLDNRESKFLFSLLNVTTFLEARA